MRTASCGKRRIVLAVVTLVLVLGPLSGADGQTANLVKNGDAEAGLSNWDGFDKAATQGAHSGNRCFARKGFVVIRSKELIPIDTDKTSSTTPRPTNPCHRSGRRSRAAFRGWPRATYRVIGGGAVPRMPRF